MSPSIEMRNIRKTFGPIRALSNVSFSAYAGEVHALMGENGAGKSTLMKILSGAYRADPGGEILISGRLATIASPGDSLALGIAIIYQELSLAPNMTAAENIFLGRERQPGGRFSRKNMERAATSILESLGVRFPASTVVSQLSMGERQLVEIARALSAKAKVLIMDEPTASLSAHETERLFDVIRSLRSQGLAIIYISHRMDEVYALADRVSVLRDGVHVGVLDRSQLSAEVLIRMMVGRDVTSFYTKNHVNRSERTLLSVCDLGDGSFIRECSFDLREGEVLGLAGLVGAGRTELARLIYGADPRSEGSMALEGRPFSPGEPMEAIEAGLAYLTEDRKGLGLFLDMSVAENVNLGVLSHDSRLGLLDPGAIRARARRAMQSLGIRCRDENASVGTLSGGNQQKVLISRLLETNPKVLILDEPTRGVDVGAKSEIYHLIDDLAKRGVAILVISSELPEILGICDRTLVMRSGRIVGELSRNEMSQEAIMALVTGAPLATGLVQEGARS